IAEPPGGAHADPEAAAVALGETLRRHVRHMRKIRIEKLLKRREEKYLSMGALSEKRVDRRRRGPVQGEPQRIFLLAVRRAARPARVRDRGGRAGAGFRAGSRRGPVRREEVRRQ